MGESIFTRYSFAMRGRRAHALALCVGSLAWSTLAPACAGHEDREADLARPAPVERAPTQTPPRPSRPTVLWIGGDVMPSPALRRAARSGGAEAEGFARTLAPAAELWRADGPRAVVLVNLETPVAREVRVANDAFRSEKIGERLVRAPLNGPAWILDGLHDADVDAVMLANNHTLDQERAGLGETLDAAWRAGLVTTGAGLAPNLAWPLVAGGEQDDVAVLTWIERDFPEPRLDVGTAGISVLGEQAIADVARAHREHGAVVAVIHVVAELDPRVHPSQRAWAERLAEAGADLVVFHGQHVPAPVERIRASDGREVVIAFGIGNLVSDMGSHARPGRDVPEDADKWERPDTREALLVRFELFGGRASATFVPLVLTSTHYLVYNGALAGPPELEVDPVAACGPPMRLPSDWPADLRDDLLGWISERRDHLLAAAHLSPAACEPGRVVPLAAPPIRGTM